MPDLAHHQTEAASAVYVTFTGNRKQQAFLY